MYKVKIFLIFTILFLFNTIIVRSQSLENLSNQAITDTSFENRLMAANQLKTLLLDTLSKNPLATFTTHNNFSALFSNDKQVHIYTWCVPLEYGFYEYFGIIQTFFDSIQLFELKDGFVSKESRGDESLDKDSWYGALYTQLIEVEYKEVKYFTLLGWKGNDAMSDVKVIEILYFNENGEPKFGKELFGNCQFCTRILLQYRQGSTCSLKYEKQSGKFNNKRITKNMIVFDHLAPENNYFEGMKSMYVPTDSYDAYFWDDGIWNFIEDIDARNMNQKPAKSKKINL